jgi:hypothetical protein
VNKIVAQVAVEACSDQPKAYSLEDLETVLAVAIESGVSPFYTDHLAEIIAERRHFS